MKRLSGIFTFLSFVGYLAGQDLFKNFPQELQTEIIAHAYVQYEHPQEFTNLALVAKYWYSIIKNPPFMVLCKAKGYMRPELMFYHRGGLAWSISDDVDLLFRDGLVAQEKQAAQHVDLTDVNKKVRFRYMYPGLMRFDPNEKGIFRSFMTEDYVAIWVNPMCTVVYNEFFLDAGRCDCERFYLSQMLLAHYMEQLELKLSHEKQELVEKKKWCHVGMDPITAKLKKGDMQFYAPIVLFDSLVLPEKLVKKWPHEYNFKAFDGKAVEYSQAAYSISVDSNAQDNPMEDEE